MQLYILDQLTHQSALRRSNWKPKLNMAWGCKKKLCSWMQLQNQEAYMHRIDINYWRCSQICNAYTISFPSVMRWISQTYYLLVKFSKVVNSKNNCRTRKTATCQVWELQMEPCTQSSRVWNTKNEPRIFNFGSIELRI